MLSILFIADLLGSFLRRANRAQYTEVPFQTVVEDEIANVDLPSVQGIAEDEGINFK